MAAARVKTMSAIGSDRPATLYDVTKFAKVFRRDHRAHLEPLLAAKSDQQNKR
jgi:hypothetical protein